jgi:hypothetical protein
VVLVVLATPDAATERELELTLTREGPNDTGFRLPHEMPDALSIVSSTRAAPAHSGSATTPVPPASHSVPRWPAERRAAGAVPDFVPAPALPHVAPPI